MLRSDQYQSNSQIAVLSDRCLTIRLLDNKTIKATEGGLNA